MIIYSLIICVFKETVFDNLEKEQLQHMPNVLILLM